MKDIPFEINSKLPNVGTTIFTVMSSLAVEHQAINLSQGFPDFPLDENLLNLIGEKYKAGLNQYAPMPGVPVLREAIAAKCMRRYGIQLNADDNITVTPGATEAIFAAITAVVHPGDEVIVFEPAYDCYIPAIELAGAKVISIPLKGPSYRIPWHEMSQYVNAKTRMIIFNTPHNPTGTVWEESDLAQLYQLVKDTNIILMSDEVYEHIYFDSEETVSILRHPQLAERSFAIYSFGKTFHATGWKVGYVIAPKELTKEFRKVHQFNVFSTHTPIQHALAEYMQTPAHYESLPNFYQQKRDYFLSLIQDLPFTFTPSKGSYFQVVDYSAISDLNDLDFAKKLTIEAGVATVPVSAFYKNGSNDKFIRFCFAKREETLQAAAERLLKYFNA